MEQLVSFKSQVAAWRAVREWIWYISIVLLNWGIRTPSANSKGAVCSKTVKSYKDFIDTYELLQNGGALRLMLEDFGDKFKADPVSALRGLTYFDDAETEPMPEMLVTTDWEEIKAAHRRWVREVMG